MFVIRPAISDDLPGIYEIFRDAALRTTTMWKEDPGALEERRAWLLLKRAQGLPVFVAVRGRKVLGYASLGEGSSDAGRGVALEHSICVAASARRCGVGRALLSKLIGAAREIRCRRLVAVVEARNGASLSLHRGFGFREIGRRRGTGHKSGRRLDLVLLQKRL